MRYTIPEVDFPKPGAPWLAAPDERSPTFLPAFARVSLALQAALRELVPVSYFEVLERFRDPKRAYPMLIYQASRPFRGRTRTDLTYDVLNPKLLVSLLRSAKTEVGGVLERAEARLNAAGWPEVARLYQARRAADIIQSVQRLSKSRKCLYTLVRAEGVLVDALVGLGGLGNLSAKAQLRRAASFHKRWGFQLRRLYPGTDFLWLGPELMNAATKALAAFLNPEAAPEEGLPQGELARE